GRRGAPRPARRLQLDVNLERRSCIGDACSAEPDVQPWTLRAAPRRPRDPSNRGCMTAVPMPRLLVVTLVGDALVAELEDRHAWRARPAPTTLGGGAGPLGEHPRAVGDLALDG